MLTMHKTTLRRLERMLERHVSELQERKHTLRSTLTDEAAGFGPESEWGFACDARGRGVGRRSNPGARLRGGRPRRRKLRAPSAKRPVGLFVFEESGPSGVCATRGTRAGPCRRRGGLR